MGRTHASYPANPHISFLDSVGRTSLGCFGDDSARVLNGAMFTDNEMTPDLCASLCTQNGFGLFGVEYGWEVSYSQQT